MIFEVPESRRYWVVRAESGVYYDHFIKYETIALGHLDGDIGLESSTEPFRANQNQIEKYLLAQALSSKEVHSISIYKNQLNAFINSMQIGDWVLTVGSRALRIGRIIGHPRYQTDPLTIIYDPKTDYKVEMTHRIRRSVMWGPEISREKLPYGLLLSLKANQTLFNIDKHWNAVCHTFYPVFIRGDNLYLSSRINAESNIKNYSLTSLFSYLNDIEVIAKEFDRGLTAENFENYLNKYVSDNLLTTTTQAQFHSPGEIWNMVTGTIGNVNVDHWIYYLTLGYSMLFGNQKLGFDGLIDIDTRKKLWDICIDRMNKRGVIQNTRTLDLSAPVNKTEALEDKSRDET